MRCKAFVYERNSSVLSDQYVPGIIPLWMSGISWLSELAEMHGE